MKHINMQYCDKWAPEEKAGVCVYVCVVPELLQF